MMIKQIPVEVISYRIHVDNKEELSKQLYFLDSGIQSFELVCADQFIEQIVFSVSDTLKPDSLNAKAKRFFDNEYKGRTLNKPAPFWRSECHCDEFSDVMDQLEQRGDIRKQADGQYAVGGVFLKLIEYIDTYWKDLSVREFGAKEYRYPTMLPAKVLEKCGSFNNFPQLIYIVSHLHCDLDNYEKFRAAYQNGGLPDDLIETYCSGHDNCLPPAICYHAYHQHSDSVVTEDNPVVLTAQGKAFRFEGKCAQGFERLFDFTLRETVFMGSPEFAINNRMKLLERVKAFINHLCLDGFLITANDPFFLSEDDAMKTAFQNELQCKYEVHVKTGNKKSVSVGSLNIHLDFFGSNFNIKSAADQYIHTACCGFGLERFAYAFLCQHGLDPSEWPICI